MGAAMLDETMIDRIAEEGSRSVALSFLAEVDAAAETLAAGTGGEALHDFRVALRRLRTTLRAYRPWLEGSVRKKDERRLKKIVRGTGAARDAEVELAWLGEARQGLSQRHAVGAEFLAERLKRPQDAWAEDQTRTLARYRRVSAKLAEGLLTYRGRLDADAHPVSFGGALASVAAAHLGTLRERLATISGAGDQENVHRARIEGKKLRYLLEPLRANRHADAQAVVKRLKKLQDVLGDLHDCHTLAGELASALVDASAERARRLHAAAYEHGAVGTQLRDELRGGPRAGLLVLDRLVRSRRDALFEALERDWRQGGFEALAADVAALLGRLEDRAGGKMENVRTFLLSGLPPPAGEAPVVETEVGFLPGERLHERLRRTTTDGADHFWRGMKQGAGPRRLEVEEEIGREVFDRLWPLTEGARLRKRRHELEEGGVHWLVEEVEDAGVVLARAELASRDVDAPVPEWLRPFVVREVTGDLAYLEETLARHQGAPPMGLDPGQAGGHVQGTGPEVPCPP
jgi:CHAD domain-containing protein/CYTH domain-containing protein